MMDRTEERLRDAATALGSTLQAADIPPLRRPDVARPSRSETWRPARPGLGRWLVPLATAVAVTAILALVVVIRSLPDRPHPGGGVTRLARWPVPGQKGWTAWSQDGRHRGDMVIDAVAASSPTSGWVFATDNAGTGLRPIAWRLAGSAWTQVPFPGRPGEDIAAAGASSPANAWAFTGANRALHWNGRAWRVVTGFPGRNVSDAVVLGPADVWVFSYVYPQGGGGHSTWHYDGQTWTRVRAAADLQNASAVSASDLWVAGMETIGHWNGTAWTKASVLSLLPRRTQYCGGEVTSIYGVSGTDAWATGWQGCQDTGGLAVLLHYSGGRWHRVARLGQVEPEAIVPAGNGEVWVQVRSDPQQPQHTTVLRYAGGAMHRVSVPLLSQLDPYAWAVLPDGTSFAVGTHHAGRGSAVGFVVRYRP